MQTIYNRYKERLIKVSGRSRNLYLRRIIKKSSYDLGQLLGALNCYDIFIKFLWQEKSSLNIINEDIATQYCQFHNKNNENFLNETDFLKKNIHSLNLLKREIEEIERETGRYELFLGYPYVTGSINKDIQIKAPLLLFPVKLQLEQDNASLKAIPNQPISLNKTFILAYTKEKGLLTEDLKQDFYPHNNNFKEPYDIIKYLKDNDINITFQKKRAFQAFDNKTFLSSNNSLEIQHLAVLGRFSLANSIYNDYLDLERYNLSTPSIESLIHGSCHTKVKRTKKRKSYALSPYAINNLDYTQENAINAINSHNNVVIYGPPGTGKSQTIVNIISDALCKKQRVLVVSQKKAALDVVYSRLGKLNIKAMLIPDPERDKHTFFDRVKRMHTKVLSSNYSYDNSQYYKNEHEINTELQTLDSIGQTLFSPTSFGLTLQQMYAMSYSIGKEDSDYNLYKSMQITDIINWDYQKLHETLQLIKDKRLVDAFYKRKQLLENNSIIEYIKKDLTMHKLKRTYTLLSSILSKKHQPFNISKYPYSRYLIAFHLEETAKNRKSIANIADIVTKVRHPKLAKWLSISAFPALWPIYPFLKIRFNVLSINIMIDLNIAKHALEKYTSQYSLLKEVLDDKGYALVMGSLINGNTFYIQQLLSAFENYVTIRDLHTELSLLSSNVQLILNFAYTSSDKSIENFQSITDKIMPIRIYHEIIKHNDYIEQHLSKTVMFDSLRERVLKLKEEQKKISHLIAINTFSYEYAKHYSNALQAKDYLYQIQKQKKLWSMRKMIEYFEDYLLRLFPCWLLSPQAVSTIFPLKKNIFDLVIFDEASQIYIETALPSIYRGCKIVVAGDNKQLRPTSGFVRRYIDDNDLNDNMDLSIQAALEVESLLDLATIKYKSVHLSYHYRSRNAELINFSNIAFYENSLQIAPNINKQLGAPPIERIKVNGSWKNRRNHIEALAVIELIKKILLNKNSNSSIGVVTFNIEQKDYIEELLNTHLEGSPTFRKRYYKELHRIKDGENQSLFVKNLENVQGDERDIIIFSIGYAKNINNKVIARFGSLSMEGGENRLNVAITRARKKIYIVTSIEPEELTTVEYAKNNGPKLLKSYLQYARAVSQKNELEAKQILSNLNTQTNKNNLIGTYEEQIKIELEKLGYTVDTNLGSTNYKISLGIYDKQIKRYILGIECDYQAYRSSKNVIERDICRIKFLESKGWRIIRVWSRDWWQSPKNVISNIVEAIEEQRKKISTEIA